MAKRTKKTNAPLQAHSLLVRAAVLTESNFFVESNAASGFLGLHFLGGKEDAVLLLEGLFSQRQQGIDRWKISSTPSFVVNNDTTLAGNMSYEEFAEALSAYGA